MSKRFGRNQKRKLKEKVENLEYSMKLDSVLLADVRYKRDVAVMQVERMVDIIEEVCQNSIALPPKESKENSKLYPRYRLPIYEPMELTAGTLFDRDTLSYKTVDLYKLETFLRDHADSFGVSAHLRFYNGAESAYYISEEGLRCMPDSALVEHLIPEIARQLVYHMKKGLK